MREIRKSGSEGGVGFNPPFLPLSFTMLELGAGSSCYFHYAGTGRWKLLLLSLRRNWELEAQATFTTPGLGAGSSCYFHCAGTGSWKLRPEECRFHSDGFRWRVPRVFASVHLGRHRLIGYSLLAHYRRRLSQTPAERGR